MTEVRYDRILLGDCVEAMESLPPKIADLVVADPPYFLRIGAPLQRPEGTEVAGVTQDWDRYESVAAFDDFTRRWLAAARRLLKDSGALWVSGTYHNVHRVGAILTDLGFFLLGEVVWIKRNPMPNFRGVRFCNAHETFLWAAPRKASGYTFNYHAMKVANGGKQMRSDWHFPICAGRERLRTDGKTAHPTQKPEALVERIILATSNPGDLVVDPFCGTGTTAAVAKRLGRRFLTVDLDPTYVALAKQRLAGVTSDLARSEKAPT